MNINFDSVVEQPEKPVFKSVKKGAQQLTITNVEEGTAASGTPFLDITFHSDKDEADFKHKFYTSEKALPKLIDLIKNVTGSKPTGSMDTASIAASLVGQSSNFIVDANIVAKQVGDKVFNNEFATFLRFRDFANKTTPFKDEDARVEDRTPPQSVTDQVLGSVTGDDTSDLPF
jgi:hypothetical protein